MDPRAYWVGFNLVKGVGAVRLRGLLEFFGDLRVAWDAPADALAAAGLPQKAIESLHKIRTPDLLERAMAYLEKSGIQVLTWNDEGYPRRLKQVDQPPPVLYVRGELLESDDLAVAIVGTRKVTAYGRWATREIAGVLAHAGVTVVSGLARGVDAVAHQAALEAGGRTVAVLGSGVDRIYPPENLKLAERMMEFGAVISDYAPGTGPESINFPPRNRIISGLSRAVIVIEAGQESGALITAGFAAEQGRDVLALPGNIDAPQSIGCNRLIRDGAIPILSPEDVLEILNLERAPQQQAARKALPADKTEAALLTYIGHEALHVDELCARSGLPIDQVSATLTIMELKGLVRNHGGMTYAAVREPSAGYGRNSNA